MIFLFLYLVNTPMKFNKREPECNRLSLLCGDELNVDQILGEIFAAPDPVDELCHHLGGTQVGIGRECEIDDGFDVDAIIHDVTSIHSTVHI